MRKSKWFLALLVTLSMLLSIVPIMTVSAAVGDPSVEVQYSIDGENFTAVNGTDFDYDGSKWYVKTVVLPNYTKYAYVKVTDTPSGWTEPDDVQYWPDRSVSDSLAINRTLLTNSIHQFNTNITALQDADDNYIIPIKDECTESYYFYKDDSDNTKYYCIIFTALQERLTEFTDNTNNANGGKVVFVSGAAVNNDNGTITETSARGKPSTIRAIGNVSPALIGSSLFMLPQLPGSDYASGVDAVFSFRADHGGNIVVMSDTDFAGASKYEQGEDGWTRVNNRSWGFDYVNLSNGALSDPRTKNDYVGPDYLALSIKWHIESYTASREGWNLYRLVDPGVTGNTTKNNSGDSAPTAGAWFMSRVYLKSFEAGELVEVPGWGGGGSQDMAIMVQWYQDENNENSLGISYSVESDGAAYVTLPGVTNTSRNYNVTLPDNAKYAYVKLTTAEGYDVEQVRTSWDILNNTSLLGTDGSIGTNSWQQTKVPLDAQRENGAFIVPIKNENGILTFRYKNRPYKITFTAKQPRLTSFHDYTVNANGDQVFYISGAASNNNNGTITESSGRGTGAVKIRALGNISPALIGASIFMLPEFDGGTDDAFFDFTADHGGKIVVMSDTEITNAAYTSGSWTEENNGTIDEIGIRSGSRAVYPRTLNDYTSVGDYYALSFAWWSEGCSKDRMGYNAFRTVRPGLSWGTRSNTKCTDCDDLQYSTGGCWELKYCYSLDFEAGELVTVPGWGTSNDSIDSAIFVVWDDAGYVAPNTTTGAYFSGNNAELYSNGFAATNRTVIAALYDASDNLIGFGKDTANGAHEIAMPAGTPASASKLRLFVWDTSALDSYFAKVVNLH